MSQNHNPLKQFFRQPAIYLKLPSGGKFWPAGSLNMPPNQELPVLPMTAVDEINYRTPDALFNGSVIVDVVQSCIPNIVNAWHIPSNDLNAILVAIRIASYGSELDMETICTACGNEDEFSVNLNAMLDSMPNPNFDNTVSHGDLEFYFQPTSYEVQNKINLFQFEQQKTIQQIQNSDKSDDEKIAMLQKTLQQVTELTVKAIGHSIAAIKTPTALVSEQSYIEEFLRNCDRVVFEKVRERALKLKADSDLKPIGLTCSKCSNKYEQSLILDTANFFAAAS